MAQGTNADTLFDPEEETKPLEFQGLLYAFLGKAWLIALLGVVAGLFAMWYVQRLPQLYRSTTVLEIEMQEQRAIKLKDEDQRSLQSPELVQTIMANFGNRSLMESVAKALNLTSDEAFLGYPVKEPVPLDVAVGILMSKSDAALRPKTRLVDVSFTHADPVVARRVAGALVTQFLELEMEQRLKTLETQNTVLVQKASELKAKLERSEHAMQDYKKRLESVSVEDNRNLVDGKLRGLNADLTAAKGERLRIESDLGQIQKAGRDVKTLQVISSVIQDPEVAAAEARADAAVSAFSALSERYRARHPQMIQAKALVDGAQAAVLESIRTAPDRVAARYNAALSREQGLQKAVSEQEKALLELDEKVIPFRALQREMESDKALFESVLQRLKESDLAVGIQPVSFRVVEPATPSVPVPIKALQIVSTAAVGGMMLGMGLIAAIFFLDSSLRTVDDTERLIGLPVLAAIPLIEKVKNPTDSLVMREAADSPPAEAFRSLRSAVSLLGPESDRRIFLMTSAVPGEGKTTVSGNLGISFAQQGLKTLLIDADLRRPALTKLFQVTGETGVAEYIATGKLSLIPSGVENLSLIPSGAHAPNPAELLANPRFGQLIVDMARQFDRVVIDSAPLNVVSDTFSIVDKVSTICLVVRASRSPRKVVRRAVELLHRTKVRPAGIVLNCLPKTHGAGYYYYYSPHSKYGGTGTYGKGYGRGDRHAEPEVATAAPASLTATAPKSKSRDA